jgi:hypothetical protein
MSVNTLASCFVLDQNSLKTESLTKIQQVVIWALRFYFNFATLRPALRFLTVVYNRTQ